MELTKSTTDAVNKDYFNSKDLDVFYQRVSTEHTHCGIFEHPEEDVKIAKKRTTEHMASLLPFQSGTRLVDLGSGYGGAARLMAEKYGCHISCINLSEQQNAENIRRNEQAGLEHLIDVYIGNYGELTFPDSSFDLAWAQDSFFYSDRQLQAFREAHRVLKPKGEFLFCTYFFNKEHLSPEEKIKVEEWYTGKGIHKVYFVHVDEFRSVASEIGMQEVQVLDLSENIVINYRQLLKKMERLQIEEKLLSEAFFEKKKQRLEDCIKFGESGLAQWGILHFRKK